MDGLHRARVRAAPRRGRAPPPRLPGLPGPGLPVPDPVRPRQRAGGLQEHEPGRPRAGRRRPVRDPPRDGAASPSHGRLGHRPRAAGRGPREAGDGRLHPLRARLRHVRRPAGPAGGPGPVHDRLRRDRARPGTGARGRPPPPVSRLDRRVRGRGVPGDRARRDPAPRRAGGRRHRPAALRPPRRDLRCRLAPRGRFLAAGARCRGAERALEEAKPWLAGAIAEGEHLDVGGGTGPVSHFWALWEAAGIR